MQTESEAISRRVERSDDLVEMPLIEPDQMQNRAEHFSFDA